MSTPAALATVTATLQHILSDVAPGTDVTTQPPSVARSGNGPQVNIFLYGTYHNPAFSNAPMPGEIRSGESAHPPLSLILKYLITAYGDNDDDISGQQLMGQVMSLLHDHPVLGRSDIEGISPDSDLHQQFERVRITPDTLTLDDMSKLWTSFQSAEYRLSTGYEVSVVLIESDRDSKTPLPVLKRGAEDRGPDVVAAPAATLSGIRFPNQKPSAELGDRVTLIGQNLSGDNTSVRFQHPQLTEAIELSPEPDVSAAEMEVRLPALIDDPGLGARWPAGFYTVSQLTRHPDTPAWTSNSLAMPLSPQVTSISPSSAPAGDVVLSIECQPRLVTGQKVALLFGDRSIEPDSSTTPADPTAPSTLVFTVENAIASINPYVLRLRVDGADSIPVDFSGDTPAFADNQKGDDNVSTHKEWMDNNDQHLAATVNWVRLRLQQLARSSPAGVKEEKKASNSWFSRNKKNENKMLPAPSAEGTLENIEQARLAMIKFEEQDPPPALNLLAQRLGLSKFDCCILALCAAVELDTGVAGLCAGAQGDANKPYPTFALAFVLFEDVEWNALSPHAPLRYWRLLEIHQPGTQPLTSASLGADERIVNYLKGLNYLDDRLTPLLDAITVEHEPLPPSQQRTIDAIVENLQLDGARPPFIELLGSSSASKRLIAAHVSVQLGLSLQSTNIKSLPNQVGDLETFLRLWERESLLMPLALYIDVDGIGDQEKAQLNRFLDRTSGVVFVDLDGGNLEALRNRFSVEISKPSPEEQQRLWVQFLQDHASGYAQRLSEQFSFSQNEIKHLAKTVLEKLETADETESIPGPDLWQECRAAARVGMEQLAQRIEAKAQWEQLVLPAEQKTLLRQITDQVAQRNCVYEDWGFRGQMNRGLGINALFAGESGTGKTMAAEVIANALELDLYRIDLSAVVSKYIGETEKNLRKLFDAAEDSGAILFFDEADALFGKRSEVKDSHDRYANIEVNYLLQRMESYRGLAILATNMKASLDKAFMRRLRFIVDFPFPGIEERTEIWRKVFPPATPMDENFDCRRLAKLSLNGGNIHNVALNAAFMAAQKGCVVTLPLVLNAARIEYRKLERPAKESDFTLPNNLEVVR